MVTFTHFGHVPGKLYVFLKNGDYTKNGKATGLADYPAIVFLTRIQ